MTAEFKDMGSMSPQAREDYKAFLARHEGSSIWERVALRIVKQDPLMVSASLIPSHEAQIKYGDIEMVYKNHVIEFLEVKSNHSVHEKGVVFLEEYKNEEKGLKGWFGRPSVYKHVIMFDTKKPGYALWINILMLKAHINDLKYTRYRIESNHSSKGHHSGYAVSVRELVMNDLAYFVDPELVKQAAEAEGVIYEPRQEPISIKRAKYNRSPVSTR